jgi:tetratricopeptide (TPR) repeat protein
VGYSQPQNPAPKGRHKTAQGISPGSAQNQTEAPQGITISPGDCDPETLQINPESISALGSLANAYVCTARYEEALAALKKAITVDPAAPDPHGWPAESYTEMGNLQAATDELAILRKLDPKLAADIEKAIAAKHEGAKSLDNR